MNRRVSFYFMGATILYGLGIGAYFLPARVSFFTDNQQDIEQCLRMEGQGVITERWSTLASYLYQADPPAGNEQFGPCPYQDHYVKTYAIEFYALSLLFSVAAIAHRLRMRSSHE